MRTLSIFNVGWVGLVASRVSPVSFTYFPPSPSYNLNLSGAIRGQGWDGSSTVTVNVVVTGLIGGSGIARLALPMLPSMTISGFPTGSTINLSLSPQGGIYGQGGPYGDIGGDTFPNGTVGGDGFDALVLGNRVTIINSGTIAGGGGGGGGAAAGYGGGGAGFIGGYGSNNLIAGGLLTGSPGISGGGTGGSIGQGGRAGGAAGGQPGRWIYGSGVGAGSYVISYSGPGSGIGTLA